MQGHILGGQPVLLAIPGTFFPMLLSQTLFSLHLHILKSPNDAANSECRLAANLLVDTQSYWNLMRIPRVCDQRIGAVMLSATHDGGYLHCGNHFLCDSPGCIQ